MQGGPTMIYVALPATGRNRPDGMHGPSGRIVPRRLGDPQNFEHRVIHVLVVDDDPGVRTMIADYLGDQNVRVSTAADSHEMARVLAAGGVDLAILDLKLGNENGLEIVRSLRAVSDLPIIVAHRSTPRGGRPCRRTRARRRRLSDQAVQSARAPGAHPRRAAALRDACRARQGKTPSGHATALQAGS